MVPLTDYADVDAELAATADYDVANDVAKAKRRVIALRRKLDFAANSMRDGSQVQFDTRAIQSQLEQALAFVIALDGQSPSVVHADFTTFRGGE